MELRPLKHPHPHPVPDAVLYTLLSCLHCTLWSRGYHCLRFMNEEPEDCLIESPQGLRGGSHARSGALRSCLFSRCSLGFPICKMGSNTSHVIRSWWRSVRDLCKSTWHTWWPRAAKPVKGEPGFDCLILLLLGGLHPTPEPSITSNIPAGEFGAGARVSVRREDPTALMLLKIQLYPEPGFSSTAWEEVKRKGKKRVRNPLGVSVQRLLLLGDNFRITVRFEVRLRVPVLDPPSLSSPDFHTVT